MKKNFKKPQAESQIVWKNTNPDVKFNPWKKYYGLIKVADKLYPYEYEGKFRSEAIVYFEEVARMVGGQIDTIGVYK